DVVVVEGDVEVDVLGAVDQAVVGDDRDVLVRCGLQLGGQRGAVDGGDYQDVAALGDHLVDLLLLGGDVVIRELQVDFEASFFQLGLDGFAVGNPALGSLGWHSHTDLDVLRGSRLFAASTCSTAGATAAASRQCANQRQ